MRRIGCSGSCCDNSGPAGPKLIIVNPDTVVGWHRAGVRLYRRWRSRGRCGRPRIRGGNSRPDPAPGTRKSGLGCSKIHGELRKLGFRSPKGAWHDIYGLWCAGAIRAKRGLGFFLRNHREAIVGLDMFTVPTATIRVVVLPFRDRSWTASDPALQRHTTPVGRLGGAAVAIVFSGSGSLS